MNTLKTTKAKFFYACSALGVNLLNLMMGSYLCSAIIASGFGEDAIKNHTFEGHDLVIAGLWAVFGVVAKIIDGVIDIPMAQLSDRFKSKWGRRRPSILIGMIIMMASYALFMYVPNKEGITLFNTIYFFVILAIFYTSYTLTMVSYYATFTEIVDNEKDRKFISNVKSVCDIVYFILGYVVVSAMLKGFNIRIVALLVLPLTLTMLIPLFMIKEESTVGGKGKVEQTVNIVKSLGYTLKNKDFILWMVVYSFMTFGVQLFLSGINEYFSVTGLSMIIVMASSFSLVPFTFIIYNYLVRKKGFRFAFQYTLLVFAISMFCMFLVSYLDKGLLKTILAVVCGIGCSFAIGAIFSVAYSIPSQLAADDEERTGISHSAMYFAVQGLFAGVASGIGGTAVLTLLKKTTMFDKPGSYYITLVTSIACLVAFALTYILPRSIVELGMDKPKVVEEDEEFLIEEI